MTPRAELIDQIAVQNILGEGVIWDDRINRLMWSDIQSKQFYRYSLESKALENFELPNRLCSFALTADTERLLAAFEDGLAIFEPGRSSIEYFYSDPTAGDSIRFNDGRVDRQGRFWVGTMVDPESTKAKNSKFGRLYRVDHDQKVTVHAKQIGISNSICWSPDSSCFYFADTAEGHIRRYDFDSNRGEITNRQIFATADAGSYPDGSDVDSKGFLWNAQWGGSKIVRYSPDGTIDFTLALPVQQPTCIAFGGPELNILFVTSARQGLGSLASESDGDVLIYQTDCIGLSAPKFGVV